jgi:hypothetical protein
MTATEFLKQDHRDVERLFVEFEQVPASDGRRRQS